MQLEKAEMLSRLIALAERAMTLLEADEEQAQAEAPAAAPAGEPFRRRRGRPPRRVEPAAATGAPST